MKNGFTLIELLGVIIILGILGVIAITTVDKNTKNGIYRSCLAQEKILKEAAKTWVIDNSNDSAFNDASASSTKTKNITVVSLEDYGYLEKNTKNPATDAPYSSSTYIAITYNGAKYTYSIEYINENDCESQKVD